MTPGKSTDRDSSAVSDKSSTPTVSISIEKEKQYLPPCLLKYPQHLKEEKLIKENYYSPPLLYIHHPPHLKEDIRVL